MFEKEVSLQIRSRRNSIILTIVPITLKAVWRYFVNYIGDQCQVEPSVEVEALCTAAEILFTAGRGIILLLFVRC
jgi:hypothetical protein